MKKKWFLAMMLSILVLGNCFAQATRLSNTTWQSADLTGGAGIYAGVEMYMLIDFGDSNCQLTNKQISNGIDFSDKPIRGTYKISGDKVIVTFSTGDIWTFYLLGNSLTWGTGDDEVQFRRIDRR